MRRFVAIAVVVVVGLLIRFEIVDGQEKKAPARSETLETLQADGLKSNQDIKVAEARVRLAEAELERTRVRIRDEIAMSFRETQVARTAEREGKVRFERASKLFAKGVISNDDQGAAALTWAKLKSARVVAEERLRILVGRKIGDITEPPTPDEPKKP